MTTEFGPGHGIGLPPTPEPQRTITIRIPRWLSKQPAAVIGAAVIVVGLGVQIGLAGASSPAPNALPTHTTQPAAQTQPSVQQTPIFATTAPTTPAPVETTTTQAPMTTTTTHAPVKTTTTKSLTASQEQAIESAQSYLDTLGGFSRKGLIDQLKYEGFSSADATFAVDYLKVNWNEQAAIAAQSYIDNLGGFSRKSLIDQLEFDGFTQSQAQYGANSVGL